MDGLKQDLSPLQTLIFAYAKSVDRRVFQTLFALDNRCGQILRGTNETMLGQMRLAWWRDVMGKPVAERPVGDPVLAALLSLETAGLTLSELVPIMDAWELLLVSDEISLAQVEDYAEQRGGTIFTQVAKALCLSSEPHDLRKAGIMWAKWDLVRHSSDEKLRMAIIGELKQELESLADNRFPRQLRPFSIFSRLVRHDVMRGTLEEPLQRPATAGRIIWHGLTGL